MAYAQGPYSAFTSLPSPDNTYLHSARSIDPVRRIYVLDADGNPEGMPSTRQRVMLAIDFGTGELPKFQTDRDLARRRAAILKALSGLIAEGAIRVNSEKVIVAEDGAGRVVESIEYTDLQTGNNDTLRRWRA